MGWTAIHAANQVVYWTKSGSHKSRSMWFCLLFVGRFFYFWIIQVRTLIIQPYSTSIYMWKICKYCLHSTLRCSLSHPKCAVIFAYILRWLWFVLTQTYSHRSAIEQLYKYIYILYVHGWYGIHWIGIHNLALTFILNEQFKHGEDKIHDKKWNKAITFKSVSIFIQYSKFPLYAWFILDNLSQPVNQLITKSVRKYLDTSAFHLNSYVGGTYYAQWISISEKKICIDENHVRISTFFRTEQR